MNTKQAKGQFTWGFIITIWGSEILEELTKVSPLGGGGEVMSRILKEEKEQVNSGLCELFTSNLDQRVKLFYTYVWVMNPSQCYKEKACFL